MTLGFGLLRISPRVFWNMTPRELFCALEGTGASGTSAYEPTGIQSS